MNATRHGIMAAGFLVFAVVLFLWGSVERHALAEEIASSQRSLKSSRIKLQSMGGAELQAKLEERRKATQVFRAQLLSSGSVAQLERALADVGAVSRAEDVDLGDYRRRVYRIRRPEGPVADWVPLSKQIASLQETPGLVVRSIRIEAGGDRESRRLCSLSLDVAAFIKPGAHESEP
ncbi:hypothetical protein [Nibricoccus sp. IMCC34717]|uniref:hypothetical protein n=1 Tax=Nibricoccus sp. IMCC34717 TaxID=3034021 RepID=UPI003850A270